MLESNALTCAKTYPPTPRTARPSRAPTPKRTFFTRGFICRERTQEAAGRATVGREASQVRRKRFHVKASFLESSAPLGGPVLRSLTAPAMLHPEFEREGRRVF